MIKLSYARFCLDCEIIYDIIEFKEICPCCGSRFTIALTQWLKPLNAVFNWPKNNNDPLAIFNGNMQGENVVSSGVPCNLSDIIINSEPTNITPQESIVNTNIKYEADILLT
jgi:hypothetical protein